MGDLDETLAQLEKEVGQTMSEFRVITSFLHSVGQTCSDPKTRNEARTLYARIVQFGRNAHAGIWIDDETSDRIARD